MNETRLDSCACSCPSPIVAGLVSLASSNPRTVSSSAVRMPSLNRSRAAALSPVTWGSLTLYSTFPCLPLT
ncbi:Uncharacterised protein [Mycobacteroides abscessus subsp. abscessus]|nr:Uncharacterised protein [Mycobacteroides abscessus]SHU19286.1 Uncharacterised protein [Mycobacteroides abscessus subsp. abscessus]SHW78016.1 Uncharacterised protein [Mycobacteroides abscessus subsp. abscessus]SIM69876.1 Uncharacterised protein [Mycobacteroides abscessus subsp. abscessus]